MACEIFGVILIRLFIMTLIPSDDNQDPFMSKNSVPSIVGSALKELITALRNKYLYDSLQEVFVGGLEFVEKVQSMDVKVNLTNVVIQGMSTLQRRNNITVQKRGNEGFILTLAPLVERLIINASFNATLRTDHISGDLSIRLSLVNMSSRLFYPTKTMITEFEYSEVTSIQKADLSVTGKGKSDTVILKALNSTVQRILNQNVTQMLTKGIVDAIKKVALTDAISIGCKLFEAPLAFLMAKSRLQVCKYRTSMEVRRETEEIAQGHKHFQKYSDHRVLGKSDTSSSSVEGRTFKKTKYNKLESIKQIKLPKRMQSRTFRKIKARERLGRLLPSIRRVFQKRKVLMQL